MTTSIGGTTGVTFPDASTQNTAATGFGFKNRILNGGMDIKQRGSSFSTPANLSYTLDRWFVFWTGAAPASIAQVAGPTGFRNALQITGAASNTVAGIYQRIESYNCSDLSGATVTIQANIAVSSNQNILWQLIYANSQDSFSSSTIISSGSWAATSTATTFTATIANLPSGSTNGLQLAIFPNNAGAFTSGTITITGVQLEKGSTATSFDYRPYGTELALCQRYYMASGGAVYTPAMYYTTNLSNISGGFVAFPVTMRANPTIVLSSSGYSGATNSISVPSTTTYGFNLYTGSSGAGTGFAYTNWTASAEL